MTNAVSGGDERGDFIVFPILAATKNQTKLFICVNVNIHILFWYLFGILYYINYIYKEKYNMLLILNLRLAKQIMLRKFLLLPLILCSFIVAACSSSGPDAAAINAEFSALGIKGTINGQNINLDLSSLGNCATNIENMVIGVNAYGASISPDPRIARDYSKPVDFTLTAPDGTKAVYTVTVKGADCISTPTPTPTACTAAPIASTGFSLVFKGCDANNIATYYDKTECVRDNATGLIWEGKTYNGGQRDVDKTYTNFDDSGHRQAQGDGYRPATVNEIYNSDSAIVYVDYVNSNSICGYTNWMLPSQSVLSTLYSPSNTNALAQYFPNTQFTWYWTSSESILANDVSWAKTVRPDGSTDNQGAYRGEFKPVRLVVMK
jgi:hypothetical protein